MKLTFTPSVVAYHNPCSDGFASAWVASRFFPGAKYFAAEYENNRDDLAYWLPLVKGERFLVLDFTFEREMLEILRSEAKELLVIDHHISAMERLGDLPYCYFDLSKSGALLTWEALTDKPVPSLVKYISDHDLWKHELPFSYEIAAALCHKKKDFEEWNFLYNKLEEEINLGHTLVREGMSILEYLQDASEDLRPKAVVWNLAGREVLAVNGVGPMVNEICDCLRNHYNGPVACYEVLDGKVKFSLRSLKEVDVSEIAKEYPGGGGHKNSAAFTVPIEKVDWQNRIVNV